MGKITRTLETKHYKTFFLSDQNSFVNKDIT